MLKLVPFNSVWITHDKIDLHAIYRRPRYKEDEYGEKVRELDADGVPTWDLTGGLPVKAHNVWVGKGYEYVTLADKVSLYTAARHGTVLDERGESTDYKIYDQHSVGGPWNYKKYAEGLSKSTTLEAEQLRDDIEKFGWEAVEGIRRRSDPQFRVAEHLKKPKAEAKPEKSKVSA